eukprot:SM000014S00339  [mRNA]  locus=s14:758644:758757:- [translate_table: standard]
MPAAPCSLCLHARLAREPALCGPACGARCRRACPSLE